MWQAHYGRWFPPFLRGARVGDIEVVLLDFDTAGCVSTWLSNGGHLDPERTRILATCVEELDTVVTLRRGGVRSCGG
ncbi:hypothetical protein GCM10009557_44960 [Virgisporangium ochraceum]|uniref:Uncharacterized protein n=1 Tax=Virgisporangium ochraceum TaxID=65505 RepID=A0A8J4ED90_9ACTN|nr:hypothetical protein Voc01_026090 [Virgisporangium ochraceum]